MSAYQGFIIRLSALVGALALAVLPLSAAQEVERVVVATNVVCRAEPGLSSVPVASLDLSDVVRVERSVRLDADPADWLFIRSPRRYGPCWVYAPLTAPFSWSRPEQAMLAIADHTLATQADRTFSELVQAENLFLAPPFRVDVEKSAVLSLRRLELIGAALSKIDAWTAARDPLIRAWVLAHPGEILYNEPGGVWYVDRSSYWDLYERSRETPWAEEIAWTAASSARIGECEGRADCYLSRILDGVGAYWELYPQGRFVSDALVQAVRRAEAVTTLCQEGQVRYPLSGSVLEDLRRGLRSVVSEEKGRLLSELDVIERTCAGGDSR